MMRLQMVRFWLIGLLGAFCVGTARADEPCKPGVIFLAGGAGGADITANSLRWALKQSKNPHQLREFRWTHGKGHFLRDIQDTRNLVEKANELSGQILQYKIENPERPIYLVGKSTGTALVLMAAEKLPPGWVEKIILLSSAVSPSYDLAPALRATRTEIVSFHSTWDWFILDWCTATFGTADRYYCASAGLKGFEVPGADHPDSELYKRLRQVAWTPRMIWQGNTGAHFGTSMPLFMLREVAPLVANPGTPLVDISRR